MTNETLYLELGQHNFNLYLLTNNTFQKIGGADYGCDIKLFIPEKLGTHLQKILDEAKITPEKYDIAVSSTFIRGKIEYIEQVLEKFSFLDTIYYKPSELGLLGILNYPQMPFKPDVGRTIAIQVFDSISASQSHNGAIDKNQRSVLELLVRCDLGVQLSEFSKYGYNYMKDLIRTSTILKIHNPDYRSKSALDDIKNLEALIQKAKQGNQKEKETLTKTGRVLATVSKFLANYFEINNFLFIDPFDNNWEFFKEAFKDLNVHWADKSIFANGIKKPILTNEEIPKIIQTEKTNYTATYQTGNERIIPILDAAVDINSQFFKAHIPQFQLIVVDSKEQLQSLVQISDWMSGVSIIDGPIIVHSLEGMDSGRFHGNREYTQLAIHEVNHKYTELLFGFFEPTWLREGIAEIVSAKNYTKQDLKDSKICTLKDLHYANYWRQAKPAYVQSESMVKMLLQQGKEKLFEFCNKLRNSPDHEQTSKIFESIYNENIESFEKRWLESQGLK